MQYLFENGNYKDAREHLLIAYKSDSTDTKTCFYLGKCFAKTPNPEIGLYYLNRLDTIMQPNSNVLSLIFSEKAGIYGTLENYNEKLNCLKTAYKYNPRPELLFEIASLYHYSFNDKSQALRYYKSFLANAVDKELPQHVLVLKSFASQTINEINEESMSFS